MYMCIFLLVNMCILLQTDVYIMYMYVCAFMCGHDRLCPGTVDQNELFLAYMASFGYIATTMRIVHKAEVLRE